MTKIKSFGRMLLMAFALGVLLATSALAADTQKAPKPAKPVKVKSKEAIPAVQMGLEQKAIDILKAACDRLAAARTMSFTAVVTYENPSRLGTPLAYTTKSEVILQRPDKLTVITPGDGPASEFFYDGKTMTAFAPAENLIAVAEAPPTIDAALKVAYDAAAIYFPFTDVIVSNPYQAMSDGLIVAFYIGQSNVVGGTTTDMVAFANNEVFVQIWIGVEDKLPRRMRAVYRADAAHLRHQMELSDWQLERAVPEQAFVSTKSANANPMPFAHPNGKGQTGDKPPANDPSFKSK